jgi:hypothetical protein
VPAVGFPGGTSAEVGPTVIGLLFGLEMMRRIDPAAVSDDLAVEALRGAVVGVTRGAVSP